MFSSFRFGVSFDFGLEFKRRRLHERMVASTTTFLPTTSSRASFWRAIFLDIKIRHHIKALVLFLVFFHLQIVVIPVEIVAIPTTQPQPTTKYLIKRVSLSMDLILPISGCFHHLIADFHRFCNLFCFLDFSRFLFCRFCFLTWFGFDFSWFWFDYMIRI